MAELDLSSALRNIIIKVLALLCSLILVYVTVGFLTILTIRGFKTVKTLMMGQDFGSAINIVRIELSQQWKFIIKNYKTFPRFRAYFLKVILSATIPLILYLVLMYKYREMIMEWKPFKPKESQHGDAHWATAREIKKAGLFSKKGILLGKYKGRYLREYSFQHVLLFAPTGSGKGVGFMIPNLLFWEESVIVHDIKLENYELTSGYRFKHMKQKVFLWNPADQQGITHCYNPLDWIAKDYGGMVDDIQKISKFLLPKEDFWNSEARSLVTGLMLYLQIDPSKQKSLGETLRMIRSEDLAYSLAVVLDTMGGDLHPISYMNLGAFLNKADKERSGVTSTASSALELWSNPFVDTATSKSHFNMGKFRRELNTLYVGISPNNIDRLKPLLQIFYQQAATIFTTTLPKKDEKIGVMMLLDEFPSLGEMQEIKVGIAYYRGYKVKVFLVVQDIEQLKDIYKEAGMNSFLSNCSYRITFAANNAGTAKMISELLGNKTVTSESGSKPKYLDLNPGSRTVSTSKSSRNLLMPQEIITLPREEQIILIESKNPIRCNKIFYYKEKMFNSRLLEKTVIPKQEPFMIKNKPKVPEEEKPQQ
ncbi:MAG: type IV secretory system conjugative DNA transfer family protein [Rickettsiales bacterium]|jgi:type IV secretion system protein VirD4|nr:type IV secretory system conjugative DNA transfer family protein [Rickettsiales bacterium]